MPPLRRWTWWSACCRDTCHCAATTQLSWLSGQYRGYQATIISSYIYTISYCCVGASYLRRCRYMRSVLPVSNVPILHVLCSRHYNDLSANNQTQPTSKTDSAQNFRVESVLEVLLRSISLPIMPCDASWWEVLFVWCVIFLTCRTTTTMPPIWHPQYLGEWMEYNQPKLQIHSKLTEWNNVGLWMEENGVLLA